LVITGEVKALVSISPDRLRFTGRVGEALTQQIRITSNQDKKLVIKEAKARRGENISLELKPLKKASKDDGYLLTVTVTKKDVGSFGDYIEMKTNLKERPKIGIPVSGRLYEKNEPDAKTKKN